MIGRSSLTAALLLLGTATPGFARDQVSVGADTLYVPNGFDNNDNVVLMLEGSLPDSCHQLAQISVDRDEDQKTVTIQVNAWHEQRPQCAPGPFPFQSEVEIGTMNDGSWKVDVQNTSIEELLTISRASTTGQDDYLYAPVEGVEVMRNDSGALVAKLTGLITADCVAYKETQILNQGKVLVLLPIMEVRSTDCNPANILLSEEVELPVGQAPGHYLLHVRSLNGKALNHFYDVTATR